MTSTPIWTDQSLQPGGGVTSAEDSRVDRGESTGLSGRVTMRGGAGGSAISGCGPPATDADAMHIPIARREFGVRIYAPMVDRSDVSHDESERTPRPRRGCGTAREGHRRPAKPRAEGTLERFSSDDVRVIPALHKAKAKSALTDG